MTKYIMRGLFKGIIVIMMIMISFIIVVT